MKKAKGGEFAERDERLHAGNKLTAEQKLAILEAENNKLRDRINASIKYIPREIPEEFLFTSDDALVAKLQLEGKPGHIKMRKNPIMPFHVTGCSLYDGKRYYYDIKDKDAIRGILTPEEFKTFTTEVVVVPSEMNAKAKDLEEKFAMSDQAKKDVSAARSGEGEGGTPNEEIE